VLALVGGIDEKKEGDLGAVLGALVGLALTTFGFLVMRNPMRVCLLAPGAEGYYQRLVLDTTSRNQLRVLGVLVCLFGASILTAALGTLFKAHALDSISTGLWVLMGCLFLAVWGVGVVLAARSFLKGEGLDWLEKWKTGAVLGPIDVFPAITPKMQQESFFYTVALCTLASIAAIVSLLHQM
jgi:hypothetical protein